MASSATVSEPEFLAARRERAAELSARLELPTFKGRPGWEFTDITGLELDALTPAAQPRNGAAAVALFDLPAGARLEPARRRPGGWRSSCGRRA